MKTDGNHRDAVEMPFLNQEPRPTYESLFLRDTLQTRAGEYMMGQAWLHNPHLRLPLPWLAPEWEAPWIPPVNVRETDDEIILEAYLPGVSKGDIQVEIKNGSVLVISGDRKLARTEQMEGAHCRREFFFRKFYRCFALPPEVKPAGITSIYRDGILEVCLAKKPEVRQLTYGVTVQG